MKDLTHFSLFSGIWGITISCYPTNTCNMSNKYTYSVPFTEEELFQAYVTDGMTQHECADKFGVSQHVIHRAMRKMGISARKAAKRDQKGDKNASWKGGRVLVNGKAQKGHRFLSDRNANKAYFMVKDPDHPNAQKSSGYVFEHIKIALESEGRTQLNPDECVHHINFIRTDNRPENLAICSKSKHREFHGKLECLVGRLYDLGIVGFDKENGYFLKGVITHARE